MKVVACVVLLAVCALSANALPKTKPLAFDVSQASGESSMTDGENACTDTYNQQQATINQQTSSQISACLQMTSQEAAMSPQGSQKTCVSHVLGHAKTYMSNAVNSYNQCMEVFLNQ